ncbi:MAG: hypothetical protein GDA43_19950 [Hormoscilla sp. SP5CHS1]|nr:hypothetical protein [Hormoscilla sp. SP5CHS1]
MSAVAPAEPLFFRGPYTNFWAAVHPPVYCWGRALRTSERAIATSNHRCLGKE